MGNKKRLKALIECLNLKEFGFEASYEDWNNGLSYDREINSRLESAGFRYQNTPKEFSLGVPCHLIAFFEVNNIFVKANYLEIFNKVVSPNVFKYTTIIRHFPKYISSKSNFEKLTCNLLDSRNRLDEEKMEKVCKEYRALFQKHILPFFDMVPDLQTVNDEIIDKYETFEELQPFMSGHIGFKKLVIMKLCNNPRYEEYLDFYEKILMKRVIKNNNKPTEAYLFFQNLKKL